MVSRPEEAANTQSIFTLPIVFSWLICYFATLMEKEGILIRKTDGEMIISAKGMPAHFVCQSIC